MDVKELLDLASAAGAIQTQLEKELQSFQEESEVELTSEDRE